MQSKLILTLAVVAGLITTFLFFQYMKQFDAEKVSTKETVEVIVAKEKIDKNKTITKDMLTTTRIPEKQLHPNMLRSMDAVVGKNATAMIEKGEPLMTHRLLSSVEEDVYVSRKVRDGYRAVTVGVNINQSVSNLIEPEDEVDIIFSKEKKSDGVEKRVDSVVLLEKTKVLAVGRKLTTNETTEEPYVEYSSVTLEVNQSDALKLVNSAEQGNIHFILHKRPAANEQATK